MTCKHNENGINSGQKIVHIESWSEGSDNSQSLNSVFEEKSEARAELSNYHVFQDAALAEHWSNIYERVEYEGRHRFDPEMTWTKAEEAAIVRKLDFRVMVLVWLMFFSLDLVRQNLNRALASKSEKHFGNFFTDLDLTQNDVNHGLIVTYVAFLAMELPSGLISKRLGPEIWVPVQIIGWSVICAAQSAMVNKAGFFVTRVLLGIVQGGFIPDMGLYLTYFYTSKEMNVRMSWFYTVLGASQVAGSFLSVGFMKLNGWHGVAGWRYLFAFDGLISGLIGILAFLLMPATITQTNTIAIRRPWLSEREQKILVNRLLRDDPTKGDMNNRQSVTRAGIWACLTDFDAYPIYFLALTSMIPDQPPKTYLSFMLSEMGFSTLMSNLLTVPSMVLYMFNALWMSQLANRLREKSLTTMITNVWVLPCLIALLTMPRTLHSEYWNWVRFGLLSLIGAYPMPLSFMVGWVSENAQSVETRTISLCLLNMLVQVGSIFATFVYTNEDQPFYVKGNTALAIISGFAIVQGLVTRAYFVMRNRDKRQKWERLTPEEQTDYRIKTREFGPRRLDVALVY